MLFCSTDMSQLTKLNILKFAYDYAIWVLPFFRSKQARIVHWTLSDSKKPQKPELNLNQSFKTLLLYS